MPDIVLKHLHHQRDVPDPSAVVRYIRLKSHVQGLGRRFELGRGANAADTRRDNQTVQESTSKEEVLYAAEHGPHAAGFADQTVFHLQMDFKVSFHPIHGDDLDLFCAHGKKSSLQKASIGNRVGVFQ